MLLAPGAMAAPSVANPSSSAWQYTGDQALMLGSEVNFGQGISGFCTGDTQGGPYSTGGANYVYPGSQTVTAGSAYNPNSATVAGNLAGKVIAGDKTGAAAWIVSTQTEAARGDATAAMTAHYALATLSNGGPFAPQTSVSQSVKDAAAALVAQATAQAGPYTISKPTITLAAGNRTATISNLGVLSAAGGAQLSGYTITYTLTGGAVWDSTGTATLTVAAGSSQSATVTSTANGPVHVEGTVSGLPATSILVLESPVAQDIFTRGPATQAMVSSDPVQMAFSFQPLFASQVKADVVAAGVEAVDVISASVAAGEEWLGTDTLEYAPVTIDLIGVDAGTTPQAQTTVTVDNPTGGFPEVSRRTITLSGPGDFEEITSYIASTPRFVSFVIVFDVAAQPAEYQSLFTGSSVTPLWEESETVVTPWTPVVTSRLFSNAAADGVHLGDRVFVSGLPADHGTFTGSGKWAADLATMTYELHRIEGTVSDAAVSADTLIASGTIPATNGIHVVEGLDHLVPADEAPGVTYAYRVTFAGDARVPAFTTSVTDQFEQYVTPARDVKLATQAKADGTPAGKGTKVWDEFTFTTGAALAGEQVVIRAYEYPSGTTAVCTTPVKEWTVPLTAGQTTGRTPAGEEHVISAWSRDVTFTETHLSAKGEVIGSTSPCGVESETIKGSPKPTTPTTPATPVVVRPAGHLASTGADGTVITVAAAAGGLQLGGLLLVAARRRRASAVAGEAAGE